MKPGRTRTDSSESRTSTAKNRTPSKGNKPLETGGQTAFVASLLQSRLESLSAGQAEVMSTHVELLSARLVMFRHATGGWTHTSLRKSELNLKKEEPIIITRSIFITLITKLQLN